MCDVTNGLLRVMCTGILRVDIMFEIALTGRVTEVWVIEILVNSYEWVCASRHPQSERHRGGGNMSLFGVGVRIPPVTRPQSVRYGGEMPLLEQQRRCLSDSGSQGLP